MAGWTADEDEKLRALHNDGTSFAAIARQLGKSRCAAIGRAHRLKLPPRTEGINPRKAAARRLESISIAAGRSKNIRGGTVSKTRLAAPKPARPIPASKIESALFDATALNIPLMEIGFRQCRYIVAGTREEVLFCGHETDPKSSWCPHHRARVFGGFRSEEVA